MPDRGSRIHLADEPLNGVPARAGGAPRWIVPGESGLACMPSHETGLASVDPISAQSTPIGLPDLPGVNIRMAARPGDPRLVIVSGRIWPEPESARIGLYDTA